MTFKDVPQGRVFTFASPHVWGGVVVAIKTLPTPTEFNNMYDAQRPTAVILNSGEQFKAGDVWSTKDDAKVILLKDVSLTAVES